MIVLYHGRTRWEDDKAYNFNVKNDVKAAKILFSSNLPLILFDTGTYLRCPMEKTAELIAPYGALGWYIHEFRLRKEYWQSTKKGFFDLGDIAALIDSDQQAMVLNLVADMYPADIAVMLH